MEPPVVDGSVETDEVDTQPADDIETCEAVLNERVGDADAAEDPTVHRIAENEAELI